MTTSTTDPATELVATQATCRRLRTQKDRLTEKLHEEREAHQKTRDTLDLAMQRLAAWEGQPR
jgi:hypothetical protein